MINVSAPSIWAEIESCLYAALLLYIYSANTAKMCYNIKPEKLK